MNGSIEELKKQYDAAKANAATQRSIAEYYHTASQVFFEAAEFAEHAKTSWSNSRIAETVAYEAYQNALIGVE